jgi:anti-sigma regulatory factor (Ser/Thr protein kinase)
MENKLTLRIKNDFSEIEALAQAVNDFIKKLQLPVKIGNSIDLALDEILNNIILYGYEDKNQHFIDILISLEDDYIVLEIRDDGREFNPLDIPEPDTESGMDERPIGGLGLHLIRNMMDEIQYTYENKKNCLIMKKKIKEN